ncbi:rhomboid family intramembrane serine protease [Carboxylicivirga marina]|uniref:Rhomboid family intramembrane serine protease n=1 Tax=Carboxylicivirga marina TaxID=2800988 RepID=A0ABS1HPL1_9BACT|nr:rhomboid family intramembrane serine protease [Carboxylicivirga marina]MBK3519617.1 rhomboid family intramembrane serine protease [Carboxylicivirga marina]
MKDKLQIIYKPAILTLIVLVIGYTSLHWLIFIELELFSLKKMILDFGIPITLAGLVAWIYIRPKLKILDLEISTGSMIDFCTMLVWMGITAPMIIAQNYIQTSTGKLTELTSINEINNYEETKYYTLDHYYIDKSNIGVYHDYEVVTTKSSSKLHMMLYVAMPIYESEDNVNLKSPIGWLGHEYRETISNRLSSEQKETKNKEFTEESQTDFNDREFSKFNYFDRLGNSKEFDGFSNAIKANKRFKRTDVILVGENEPFSERNGNRLFWIFGSSLISCVVWLIMILIPSYDTRELNRIKAGKPDREAQQDLKDFLGYITFKDGYVITPLILYGIVLMYLIMTFGGYGFLSFKGQDLIKFGANYGPITKGGEWWRLLTCVFLHGGIMHLILNISGLVFVSFVLEPFLGQVKYLLLFLVTGILASVTSLWWHDSTISIGASGAIFGLYGAFISLMLTKSISDEIGGFFLTFSLIFIGINLLFGLSGGIDNAAHIGGLLSGFICGLILYPIILIEKKTKESTAANNGS